MSNTYTNLDAIYAIPTPSRLDAAVMAYGDWQAASDEDLAEAEEAAAELVKHREEIQILKALLYESKQINALVNSEGGGAWGMVKDDLDERIDEVLNGFTPDAN